MQVNGIITEYNPFHHGHKYQLEESRRLTGADFTVVAMSGNFVQRGAPALLDKHTRAEMALRCGADLVLELPVLYALSSSEAFAAGAVALLDRLGPVTHLCFGSECGDTGKLAPIASVLLEEPKQYRSCLQKCLRQGLSYPAARLQALAQCPGLPDDTPELLASPNNILGIDYMKALLKRKSAMRPLTVKRIGQGYHDGYVPFRDTPDGRQTLPPQDDSPSSPPALSAYAIRQALQEKNGLFLSLPHMPPEAGELLRSYLADHKAMESDDFSQVLYYKLLLEKENGYEKYLDVSPGLSDRIRRHLKDFRGFTDFCDTLKTKDMTYTRIARCMLHILLGLEKVHMASGKSLDYAPYAKVLGFRRRAAPLLHAIKDRSSLIFLPKLADAGQKLPPEAFALLKLDLLASEIYHGIASSRSGLPLPNELSTPLIIL